MGGTSITWLWISDREYNPSGSGTREAVRVPDTLLGPEGTGNRSFETDARELMLMGVSVGARSADVLPGLPASAPHHDLEPARTLRTAQWTRASSFLCSSY